LGHCFSILIRICWNANAFLAKDNPLTTRWVPDKKVAMGVADRLAGRLALPSDSNFFVRHPKPFQFPFRVRSFKPKRVLVIDVGGSNVKVMATGQKGRVKIRSGQMMTAAQMVREVRKAVRDWKFDAVSVGYPGLVRANRPVAEPQNLGGGWRRFNFERAFNCPVRILNDAAMQALAHARAGRVLFIGLGTGFGSAMIEDGQPIPLELCQLRYSRQRTVEDILGKRGVKTLGASRWEDAVHRVVGTLREAFIPDVTVIGGGNAKKLKVLPPGCIRGENADAFIGGFRLWGLDMPSQPAKTVQQRRARTRSA
jgi:hypothetical protein